MSPEKELAATYKRAPESRGKAVPYELKFAGLIRLCENAKVQGLRHVVITWPWVIGDTYEEIVESLSRIAAAGLVLHIVERGDDDHISPAGIENN